MAQRDVQAVEFVCDGCKKIEIVEKIHSGATTPPDGWLSGTAMAEHIEATWDAHNKGCVGNAVAKSLDNATSTRGED